MKVLALNSSPRISSLSKTDQMLVHLVKGMRDAGAEVEVVNLRQKKINLCSGCFTCWTKTPGVCVHKDDMSTELFPMWLESDIVIYASPLYYFTINAQMKAFIERTLPVLMPFMQRAGESTSHPLRGKFPLAVTLSVAGFPDLSAFNALSVWAKRVFGPNLIAEIYRPEAESMFLSWKLQVILEALEQAGREIVSNRTVSEETMSRICQPIVDPEIVATVVNMWWNTLIDRGLTAAEASRQDVTPHPDSIESMLAILSFAYNPLKLNGKKGTLQFNMTGDKAGSGYLVMSSEGCKPFVGQAENASCTVESLFEVWADIIEGKADGAKAFMDGSYKAQGDISLMMAFGNK